MIDRDDAADELMKTVAALGPDFAPVIPKECTILWDERVPAPPCAPKPLHWIVGGMGITAYANAFGIFGFYRILGERAPWSLQYPEGTCFRTDEGFETQAAARRFAQDHYAGLVREALLP